MKTRCGFVSNSSSSSFVLYGEYIEAEEVQDVFLKYITKYTKENYPEFEEIDRDDDIADTFLHTFYDDKYIENMDEYEIAEMLGIDYDPEEGYIVGFSPDEITVNPNMTFNQIQAKQKQILKDIGFNLDDVKFDLISFVRYG